MLFLGRGSLGAQTPANSEPSPSVPSWFTHCAGENGQCVVYGPAQVIFGSATGVNAKSGGTFLTQSTTSNVLCSDSVFGDPDPGNAKACWYGPPASLGSGKLLNVGGSNYPFYVQNFGVWDTNERVLVGTYHLAPELVQAQLEQMYKSGQRSVAIPIWYMPFVSPDVPIVGSYSQWPDVWVAWVNSNGGQLSVQAQQNLAAILGLIKQIGFQQVTLRFSPIGATASPTNWGNTWNESAFQQDEAFIFSTRQIAEAALAGSSVVRAYDLGIELAGIPHNLNADGVTYSDGQTQAYTERLWADYVRNYGKADSYGFSIAYAFGDLTTAIAEFDAAGMRPDSYGLDLYTPTDLWNCYEELVGKGEEAKPVVLQESFYNDATEMQGIQTALQHFPLTIAHIDQWPVEDTSRPADGMIPPTNYGSYGGSSATSGTVLIAPCTLATGQTSCATQVSWSTSNATSVVLYMDGIPVQNASNITSTLTGTATVTLGLTPTAFALVSNSSSTSTQGSSAPSNQTTLATLVASAIDPAAPVVASVSLGGVSNTSLSVVGTNLAATCSIELFDPKSTGASPLTIVNGLTCATGSLFITVPNYVLTNYAAVDLVLVNPGLHASQPYYVPLQLVPALSMAGVDGTEIWANGSDISSACTVQLFDSSSTSTPLTTVSAVSCNGNRLSFPLPQNLIGSYASLSLTVTNADGQTSAPLLFTLPGAISQVCGGPITRGANNLIGNAQSCR